MTSHPLSKRTGARGWPSFLSCMSWLQQRLNQKNLAHATWPRPATTTAKAEKTSFVLRERIQELEATLRDQQQESRMWQKRLDLVLDQVLSNECIEDKDDAHYAGEGLHWVPSSRCALCHRIRTSLQEPMPEHAPRFNNSLPYYQDEEDFSLKKNVLSPVHHHCSSSHAFRSTRSTPPTLGGGYPGTKHEDARSHHRRTVPSRATRYPHCIPLWFAPSPARHGRNGTDGRPCLVIGQELVAV